MVFFLLAPSFLGFFPHHRPSLGCHFTLFKMGWRSYFPVLSFLQSLSSRKFHRPFSAPLFKLSWPFFTRCPFSGSPKHGLSPLSSHLKGESLSQPSDSPPHLLTLPREFSFPSPSPLLWFWSFPLPHFSPNPTICRLRIVLINWNLFVSPVFFPYIIAPCVERKLFFPTSCQLDFGSPSNPRTLWSRVFPPKKSPTSTDFLQTWIFLTVFLLSFQRQKEEEVIFRRSN